MHELFRAMELVRIPEGQYALRYGGLSSECFFILSGTVLAKVPGSRTFEFEMRSQLLEFCRSNYKDIIWEKTPDGISLRTQVQEFIKKQYE